MWPSLKPSQREAILGVINPQSAAAVQTTGWIDASLCQNYEALLCVGVISAGGTVDAKFQQAQDNAGTGAKDIAGKAIAQLTQAGGNSNTQCRVNVKQDDLDVTNGFGFIRFSVTPATAAALISAVVQGVDARYGPADGLAAASQAQVVG